MEVAWRPRGVTRRPLLTFVVALAVVVAAAGCGGSASSSRGRPVFTDPGTPITVHNGQVFEVHLSSNASTGFTWRVGQTAPQLVLQVGARYVAPKKKVGAPGTAVLRFKAIARGHGGLGLAYVGPGRAPATTRTVTFELTVS